jgi:hypothetical protein
MLKLIPFVVDLGKQWLDNRKAKSEAKHARELRVINGEIDSDVASSEGMSSTLKDEYLTLVLTTPLIVIFYSAVWGDPAMIDQVKLAFKAMSELPTWYQWSFMGCVAATFGIRSMKQFGGK